MLLLIDNFDSFTYNLVHAFWELDQEVTVIRNHAISMEECLKCRPDALIIGPGPGNPAQAGISKECIEICAGRIPILGVCLGHQAIAEVFGGHVIHAQEPMHGKTSPIFHQNEGVFRGLPQGFVATRYHSLVVNPRTFPTTLVMTAQTEDGEIMGLRHRDLAIEGVQFHPESIASECGLALLSNFLKAV